MSTKLALALTTLIVTAGCSKSEVGTASLKAEGADTYGWCHAPQMRSADGTNILFDYQVTLNAPANGSNVRTNYAAPGWLNVSKFGFNGSERVNAVVLAFHISTKSMEEYGMQAKDQISTDTIPMQWDAGAQHFSAALPSKLFLGSYYVGDDQSGLAIYQYALQVNGDWLVDPISGGHNFQYVPFQQAKASCTGQYFYGNF